VDTRPCRLFDAIKHLSMVPARRTCQSQCEEGQREKGDAAPRTLHRSTQVRAPAPRRESLLTGLRALTSSPSASSLCDTKSEMSFECSTRVLCSSAPPTMFSRRLPRMPTTVDSPSWCGACAMFTGMARVRPLQLVWGPWGDRSKVFLNSEHVPKSPLAHLGKRRCKRLWKTFCSIRAHETP